MVESPYYSITTRKFILKCGHDDWLKLTQDLYNEVLLFYYSLYLELEEKTPESLTGLSSQNALRKLETLTVIGRNKEPVPYPLPWNKVPLYFRRAAVNAAVSAAKCQFDRPGIAKQEGRTQRFHKGVTFYKGMYRDLTQEKVLLKVWNGEVWIWINCRLVGNYIPEDAEPMSPTLLSSDGQAILHLPVKTRVLDGNKAKERMKRDINVCSLQFTNEDYFALGLVLDRQGKQKAVRFFKGGNEYSHRCSAIVSKIQRSEKSMGISGSNERNQFSQIKFNQKYWMKLKHLSEYYAHLISRQIIDFCLEQDVKVILIPKYNGTFTKFVMLKSGNWSPLHLSMGIREFLSYKAWQNGIIILEVNTSNISGVCSKCGMPVKRKKDIFVCSCGNQGNKFINSARNLGIKCLESFDRDMAT